MAQIVEANVPEACRATEQLEALSKQDFMKHDHSLGQEANPAGDPPCPCYLEGWNHGYAAGEAEAKTDDEAEDDGPRLN
jgi:hypothetical protein